MITDFAKALAKLDVQWILLIYTVILVLLLLLFRKLPKTRPYVGQLMLLSGILLMGILFYIITFSFKVSKFSTGATARTMPQFWVILLVPISIATFFAIIGKNSVPDKKFNRWKLVIMTILLVVASVMLFDYIGYYVSSAVFLVLLMLLMEERRPAMLISVPVGWVVFTYFVFQKLLFISLPVGKLFEKLLS